MKKVLLSLVLVFACGLTNAQDFKKNGNYVTAGYGVDAAGLPGTFVGLGLGPIMATYERGVTDVLGIGRIGAGGGIAFSHYNYNSASVLLLSSIEHKYNTNRITPFLRATYHFEFDIPKMDVYAGIGFGVNIDAEKDKYYVNGVLNSTSASSTVRPVHLVVVGIRYYFSDSFGVYAEAGDGIANINAGIALSF